MGFENVGKVWTPAQLRDYLATIQKPAWCRAITLHHTGIPSLEQRPVGFNEQHIRNMASYYRDKLGWSAGPHLFIDDDQCWGMTDFRQYGIHAKSYNAFSIGIEVLGNYDVEPPNVGRGLNCWKTAAAAAKVILEWIGREPLIRDTVYFHRHEPDAGKDCPGKKVLESWAIDMIKAAAKPQPRASAHPTRAVAV